ncbi:MAG: ComEC/Rec2 family competence protein [Acutalibacteraceae bacterium]
MKRFKRIIAAVLAVMSVSAMSACDELQKALSSEDSIPNSNSGTTTEKTNFVSHYIDVGQGDSEFLELPNGQTMLIDASTKDQSDTIIEYIESKGYSSIDYVVATHPHTDHIGGMAAVIEHFDIGAIYMPNAETSTKTFENLLETIVDKGLKIKTAKAGVSVLDTDDLDIDILAPVQDSYKNLNNYSAVIKVTYKDTTFLYMGDAETDVEEEITADVSADVIKVGHHGSDTSSSQNFVERVSPKYAIMEVGAGNSYGHPKSEIVERWENKGATVYRTDLNGNIIITSDGKNITVKTEKS